MSNFYYDEESDIDCSGDDTEWMTSEQSTESDVSSDDNISDGQEEINENAKTLGGRIEDDFFWGKDGSIWLKNEPERQSKLPHNPLLLHRLTQKSKELGQNPSKLKVWGCFVDEDILNEIVLGTNQKIALSKLGEASSVSVTYQDTDVTEIKAFIGLLMLSSLFRNNNDSISTLFQKGLTSRPIFRATMSEKRFEALLTNINFDDLNTREVRKTNEPCPEIINIFNKFISNCKATYNPTANMTVEEMLIPFRGKCPFGVYMPKNPKRYGIKIVCLRDSASSYLYNAYISTGKGSEGVGLSASERKLSVSTRAVIRLCKPIEGSCRNITGDKQFTSVELVCELDDRSLTYVGALKKTKPEVPPEFLSCKNRVVNSALYGFAEKITLLSIVAKRHRTALYLSSMHRSLEVDSSKNDHEVISHYNKTKAGVNRLKIKCTLDSSSRRTRRWETAVFFQLINVGTVNSFIVYLTYKGNPAETRASFTQALAMDLIEPHLRRRLTKTNLHNDIRIMISNHFSASEPVNVHYSIHDLNDKLEKRRTCSRCPAIRRRKTAYKCIRCSSAICLECSRKLCVLCATFSINLE